MNPNDIKAIRAAYGIKREDFAKSIGVTKQTLYFWEHGTYYPSRYDVVMLHKLWSMLQNSRQREIAHSALHKAKNLPNIAQELELSDCKLEKI